LKPGHIETYRCPESGKLVKITKWYKGRGNRDDIGNPEAYVLICQTPWEEVVVPQGNKSQKIEYKECRHGRLCKLLQEEWLKEIKNTNSFSNHEEDDALLDVSESIKNFPGESRKTLIQAAHYALTGDSEKMYEMLRLAKGQTPSKSIRLIKEKMERLYKSRHVRNNNLQKL